MAKEANLTQLEIPRLSETFNFTDGHIHRRWDKREGKIVDRIGKLFREVNREQQPQLEREYIEAFFKLGGQTVDYSKTKYMLLNSASASLEVIANYLRLNNKSAALIEPCFDNLADIFKRHGVPLTPFPEKYLRDESVVDFLKTIDVDAICIVSPNNPTGLTYTRENLRAIATYCRDNGKILILDASFGLYNTVEHMFDEYDLINEVGVDYICVEDTGKTWPTHDIKISVLACTPSLYEPLYDIYTDFLLHVSPFAVKLLTEFFRNSDEDRLHSIFNVVQTNRKTLYKAIAGTFLKPVEQPYSSVAWLEITNRLSAKKLQERLAEAGVFVLPGNHFFWSNRKKGDKYIRVALTRDPDTYARGMETFKKVMAQG